MMYSRSWNKQDKSQGRSHRTCLVLDLFINEFLFTFLTQIGSGESNVRSYDSSLFFERVLVRWIVVPILPSVGD